MESNAVYHLDGEDMILTASRVPYCSKKLTIEFLEEPGNMAEVEKMGKERERKE